MKVILLYNNCNIKKLTLNYLRENRAIKKRNVDFLELNNGNEIIFKRINPDRPADLYKYSSDSVFVYIERDLKFYNNLTKLKQELIKSREFILIPDCNKLLSNNFLESKRILYTIGLNYSILEHITATESIPESFFDTIEDIHKQIIESVTNNIKECTEDIDYYNQMINKKQQNIQQLTSLIEKFKSA